jgi:hypothetical protein
MDFREPDEKAMGKRYGLDYFLPRLGVKINEQAVKAHLLEYIRKNPEYFEDYATRKGRTFYLEDKREIIEMLAKAVEDSGVIIEPSNKKSYMPWCVFSGQFLRGMSLGDKKEAKRVIVRAARKKGPLKKAVQIKEREMDIFLKYIPNVLDFLRKEGYNPSQQTENMLAIGADRYRKQNEAEQEALAEERWKRCKGFTKSLERNFNVSSEYRAGLLKKLEEIEGQNPNSKIDRKEAIDTYLLPPVGLDLYSNILGEISSTEGNLGWPVSRVILVQKEMIRLKKEKEQEKAKTEAKLQDMRKKFVSLLLGYLQSKTGK